MSTSDISAVPWQQNCVRLLRQRPVVVLHGNVQDYYVDSQGSHFELLSLLHNRITDAVGSASQSVQIRTYDWVRGHEWLAGGEGELGGSESPQTIADLEQDLEVLRDWLTGKDTTGGVATHVAVLMYADLLLPYQESYEDAQRHALIRLQQLFAEVAPPHRLMLVALEDAWLSPHLYTNAPHVGVLRIPAPNQLERAAFLDERLSRPEFAWPEATLVRQAIIEATDGLYLRELAEVLEPLKRDGVTTDEQVREVLREWRTGARESPWTQLDIDKVHSAREWLSGSVPGAGRGVEGQTEAVDRVARALAIARAGLSGLASGRGSKPRIALLFAGPTGVGKTELAKRLAAFVFGDEGALVRFDMSEYKDDFTISRLLGAPPGYVGHEQGGLLARAIEEKPFCVVLFDEIEKAHPKILDIFLQILDDGRVTDARGQTVFFSETAIVFTSNIGARKEPAQWVQRRSGGQWPTEREVLEELQSERDRNPDLGYRAIRAHFVEAVQRYFSDEIGRPELLNRLRNAIVAFNPIEDRATKVRIASGHIDDMQRRFATINATDGLELAVRPELVEVIFRSHLNCPKCDEVVILPDEPGSGANERGASRANEIGATARQGWTCPKCRQPLGPLDVPLRATGRFGGRGIADDLDELLSFEIARAVLSYRHASSSEPGSNRVLVIGLGEASLDGCHSLEMAWKESG